MEKGTSFFCKIAVAKDKKGLLGYGGSLRPLERDTIYHKKREGQTPFIKSRGRN